MEYVDGFVVPVPKKNLQAYRRIARKAGKIWREHGALDYRECVADDVKVGKLTSFPRSVKLKPDETVIFSWITYKSRRHRDTVNAKVMARPALGRNDERERDAVRRQAHDLRWVQDADRSLVTPPRVTVERAQCRPATPRSRSCRRSWS
ncbi:MAG: hypothetical protein QOD06_3174 [Candidatus Binatota bacterium]|jgi:uncharacterized protein YbaA (DUF1428 family)|nr:hypothetical protein [Candidatus Binatota bacterium]